MPEPATIAAAPRPATRPPQTFASVLSARGRALGARELGVRLGVLAGAAGVFPLIVVALDHALAGGLPIGVIVSAGRFWLAAVLVALVWLLLLSLVRRVNPLFVARELETSRGIGHNLVISAWLLGRDPQSVYARQAAEQCAADALSTRPPASHVRKRIDPRVALPLAVMLIWLLYAGLSGKSIWVSLERFFGALHAAPTATSIERLAPAAGAAVYASEPLAIEVAVRGRPVERVWFERLVAGVGPTTGPRDPIDRHPMAQPVESLEVGRWSVTLAAHEVRPPLRFRIRAGDAELFDTIELLTLPEQLELAVELEPPAYVHEPPRTVTDGEVHAWAGTRARFRATANTAMRDPIFVLRTADEETRTRMSLASDDAREASVSLRLDVGGEFWVEFSDSGGRAARLPERRRLIIRGDSAPTIEIAAPLREDAPDDVVDVGRFARLRAIARDDVGLEDALLVIERGGLSKSTDLYDPAGPRGLRRLELGVPTADLQIKVGQQVRCWFEIRDNRVLPDGVRAPQSTKSRVLTLVRMVEAPAAPAEREPVESDAPETPSAPEAGQTEAGARRRSAAGDGNGAGTGGESNSASGSGEPRGGDGVSTGSRSTGADADPNASQSERAGRSVSGATGDEASSDGTSGDSGATGEGPRGPDDAAAPEHDAEREFRDRLREFAERHGESATQIGGHAREPSENDGADPPSADQGSGQAETGTESQSEPPEAGPDRPPEAPQSNDEAGAAESGSDEDKQPYDEEPADISNDGNTEADDAEAPAKGANTSEPSERAPDEEAASPPDDAQESAEQPRDSGTEPRENADSQRDSGAEPQEDASATPQAQDKQSEPAGDGQSDSPEGESAAEQPSDSDAVGEENASTDDDETAEPADKPDAGSPAGAGQSEQPGDEPPEDLTAGESGEHAADDQSAGSGPSEMPGARRAPNDGADTPPPDRPQPEDETDSAEQADTPAAETTGDGADPASTGMADAMDSILDLLETRDEISEEELADLGWPAHKSRAFVKAFERLRAAALRAGVLADIEQWRTRARIGSAEVQAAASLAAGVELAIDAGAPLDDRIGRIIAPRDQMAPPDLEAILEAYYRSLAEKKTTAAPRRDADPE